MYSYSVFNPKGNVDIAIEKFVIDVGVSNMGAYTRAMVDVSITGEYNGYDIDEYHKFKMPFDYESFANLAKYLTRRVSGVEGLGEAFGSDIDDVIGDFQREIIGDITSVDMLD